MSTMFNNLFIKVQSFLKNLEHNIVLAKEVGKVIIGSLILTGAIYFLVGVHEIVVLGRSEEIGFAEYLALFAIFVAGGHLWALTKTNDEVQQSVNETRKLRADLSFDAYVNRAYGYYASARRRIFGCVQYWRIDNQWVKENVSRLNPALDRDRIDNTSLPPGLEKYLHGSDLSESIVGRGMLANDIRFLGPVGVQRDISLCTFPGVLWRALFIEALRRSWCDHNRTAEAFVGDPPLYFIVIDDKILMQSKKVSSEALDFREYGTDIGKDYRAANHLCQLFERFCSGETISSAVNNVLSMALQNSGLTRDRVLDRNNIQSIYYHIYYPERNPQQYRLATLADAEWALDRLQNTLLKLDTRLQVDDVVTGLLMDYICYVGYGKFQTTIIRGD